VGQGLGAALGIPLEQTARAEAERLYREATEANRLKDDFLARLLPFLRGVYQSL